MVHRAQLGSAADVRGPSGCRGGGGGTRGLLIQSAGPRASTTDKLTGSGVPTSIGALSV